MALQFLEGLGGSSGGSMHTGIVGDYQIYTRKHFITTTHYARMYVWKGSDDELIYSVGF